jgi:hypothetical protein
MSTRADLARYYPPADSPLPDPLQEARELVLGRWILSTPGLAQALRKRVRLSQWEVASALRTTTPSVSRWERGVVKPVGPKGHAYVRLLAEWAAVNPDLHPGPPPAEPEELEEVEAPV